MPAGTPIRLVQEGGNLIELNATNMVLTTSRKVGGSALPFTGSRRVGFDLNVNSAMINIQGVIVDDQILKGSQSASAIINFGEKHGTTAEWAAPFNLEYMLSATSPHMTIKDFDGNNRNITFTETTNAGATAYSATGGAGSTPTVLINPNDATALQIATAVHSFINNQLSSYFSSELIQEINRLNDALAFCAIRITHQVKGTKPNGASIFFSDDGGNSQSFKYPTNEVFNGGANAVKKSAGDKVQDLYGIVNNSKTQVGRVVQGVAAGALGAVGLILAAPLVITGGATAAAASGGAAAAAGGAGISAGGAAAIGAGGGLIGSLFNLQKDYIIGLQIPYNSMLKAEDGSEYSPMNFFMPTGLGFGDASLKGSAGAEPAGTEFSAKSKERTGIQGAIQKLDITYDAGETAYNFNIIFAPIDNIL